mmetsp:Transcript_73132/g.152666  ORF Transcript_73132/g.152666 Transcript_73132/m.152666 type:complete len:208 (+) Transcript_73132:364-987(+)
MVTPRLLLCHQGLSGTSCLNLGTSGRGAERWRRQIRYRLSFHFRHSFFSAWPLLALFVGCKVWPNASFHSSAAGVAVGTRKPELQFFCSRKLLSDLLYLCLAFPVVAAAAAVAAAGVVVVAVVAFPAAAAALGQKAIQIYQKAPNRPLLSPRPTCLSTPAAKPSSSQPVLLQDLPHKRRWYCFGVGAAAVVSSRRRRRTFCPLVLLG